MNYNKDRVLYVIIIILTNKFFINTLKLDSWLFKIILPDEVNYKCRRFFYFRKI